MYIYMYIYMYANTWGPGSEHMCSDQGPNTWRLGSEHTESRVLTQSNAHPSANLHAKQTHTLTHALTCVLMGAAGTTSGAVAAAGSGEEAKGLRVARPPPEQLPGPPRPPQGL